MDHYKLYEDIQARTKGEIYIGVVGPVRTGKSTFIRRFMELFVLPNIGEQEKKEIQDQLPLSGAGKLITTVEPKFIPKQAVRMKFDENAGVDIRLIDCVGYMVNGASGHLSEDRERMVKTPWFEQEIPFTQAAELGTKKVINDHSTIGFVITTDGSFGEIPRENFLEPEEKTILELKKLGKPFLVIVNSQRPFSEEAKAAVKEIEEKYGAKAIPVNCEQLRKEDIHQIMEQVLYEFPISRVEFYMPKWVEMLPSDHELKADIIRQIRQVMEPVVHIRDISMEAMKFESPYITGIKIDGLELSKGIARILLQLDDSYYYQILSDLTGVDIDSEYQLIATIRDLGKMKQEYVTVLDAMEAVRRKGYGVVTPNREEITLEEPTVIKQGNKFGVKIKSLAPSIHMIKANIETEIAPIVGSEQQAQDLIAYIKENGKTEDGIWKTNIFGKSVEDLVEDGIRNKISVITDESQIKLQDTMQKIVNDSNGGLVCIII